MSLAISALCCGLKLMDNEETSPEELRENLILVGRYPTLAQAHDRSLVVLAMGEACWVSPSEVSGEFELHVESEPAQRVIRELQIYENEQADETQPIIQPDLTDSFHFPPGWNVFLLWMSAVVFVFYLQGNIYDLTDRLSSSPIGLIDHHEWWRPFTALFLHADIQHLSGNLIGGAVFGTLVSRSIGPWRGWAVILASGTLGNLMTSLVNYPEQISSIGASTAVFGALGILAGIGFAASLRLRSRMSWAKVAAPVMAGVILLGWLGGGSPGSNTDVLGHLFGFSSGLISGFIVGELRQRQEKHARISSI